MLLKNDLSVLIVIIVTAMFNSLVFAQSDLSKEQTQEQELYHKHYLGSSLFVLANYIVSEPADYYMLSYGYHLSKKDVIVVEAWTWKYKEPLGTCDNSEEMYPGKIRAFGIGAGYQRFLWKNMYTTLEATPLLQQFYDDDDNKIQKGFQLYLQCIVGYRFEFCKKRMYIEPAYALKYWPVNTNFPDSFAAIESGKPKHIFEPSFNFGFNF